MLINEVCRQSGLTKKAVAYYVEQGILSPETMENGYRNYTDSDLSVLKEVSLLRKMGVGISDIKTILSSNDKLTVLSEYRNRMARQAAVFAAQRECIDHLITSNYDIDDSTSYASQRLDENCIIKERLAEAFPGNYGLFISFHFGRFLNEKIDSPEKESAYGKIITFLDGLSEMPLSDELTELLVSASSVWNEDVIESFDSGTNAVIEDYDSFLEQKREIIESYLEYCKSEDFKSSPAYRMKLLLTEFQRTSGYLDVFIENMKILSPAYATHLQKLQKSNECFLRDYPEAADILGGY